MSGEARIAQARKYEVVLVEEPDGLVSIKGVRVVMQGGTEISRMPLPSRANAGSMNEAVQEILPDMMAELEEKTLYL